MVLKRLKENAEEQLGQEIKNVFITVPAYFNGTQKEATKIAGEIPGLKVIKLINEPTVAALAYGLGAKNKLIRFDEEDNFFELNTKTLNNEYNFDEKNVLVFDLGGGTFDITCLKLSQKITDLNLKFQDIMVILFQKEMILIIFQWIFVSKNFSINIK